MFLTLLLHLRKMNMSYIFQGSKTPILRVKNTKTNSIVIIIFYPNNITKQLTSIKTNLNDHSIVGQIEYNYIILYLSLKINNTKYHINEH